MVDTLLLSTDISLIISLERERRDACSFPAGALLNLRKSVPWRIRYSLDSTARLVLDCFKGSKSQQELRKHEYSLEKVDGRYAAACGSALCPGFMTCTLRAKDRDS